jgi:archaellum biogenesis ATPase FlaH
MRSQRRTYVAVSDTTSNRLDGGIVVGSKIIDHGDAWTGRDIDARFSIGIDPRLGSIRVPLAREGNGPPVQ